MLHIDDAVKAGYEKVIIASPDTDIFFTALYHYTKSINVNESMQIISGKGETIRAVPLHSETTKVEITVIYVLSALHALTVCDTTSKTQQKTSKTTSLKIADTDITKNLVTFGKTDINADMIITAEQKSFQ